MLILPDKIIFYVFRIRKLLRFHSYGIQISGRVEFSDDLTVCVMLNQDEVFVMVLCKSVDETFVLLAGLY